MLVLSGCRARCWRTWATPQAQWRPGGGGWWRGQGRQRGGGERVSGVSELVWSGLVCKGEASVRGAVWPVVERRVALDTLSMCVAVVLSCAADLCRGVASLFRLCAVRAMFVLAREAGRVGAGVRAPAESTWALAQFMDCRLLQVFARRVRVAVWGSCGPVVRGACRNGSGGPRAAAGRDLGACMAHARVCVSCVTVHGLGCRLALGLRMVMQHHCAESHTGRRGQQHEAAVVFVGARLCGQRASGSQNLMRMLHMLLPLACKSAAG